MKLIHESKTTLNIEVGDVVVIDGFESYLVINNPNRKESGKFVLQNFNGETVYSKYITLEELNEDVSRWKHTVYKKGLYGLSIKELSK